MTQVANLNTGMAMPAKGDATFQKHDQSQLVLDEFASIMNQNAQGFLNTETGFEARSNEMSDDRVFMGQSTDALKKDYEKFGSSNSRKIAKAQTERTDGEVVSQKVQELAGKVKEAVKETMQVSDEEIAQAMETLGFTALDLLQPQNLIQVVQELTGSTDVSALLTNGNFQITMQEVSGLISGFQQDNGINAVQFSDLLEQLSAQIDDLEQKVKELLNVSETPESEPMTDMQAEELPEQPVNLQEMPEVPSDRTGTKTVAVVEQQSPVMQTVPEEQQSVTEELPEQTYAVADEAISEQSAQTNGQDESPMPQGEKSKQQLSNAAADHTDTMTGQHVGMFRENPAITNDVNVAAKPETPQLQSYVELEQLMEQMEGLARTFASTEGTTVEMQLNPENLGRLVLNVTEKNGNVTAQITASNDQVKEALQTQLAELRSTLEAQGIKVEAVEVTARSHEFEQNLDGNAAANGQMQEQEERYAPRGQNGRHNLNRNNLDELSGIMSEEEALVAQMMRDNGGTVDFTA